MNSDKSTETSAENTEKQSITESTQSATSKTRISTAWFMAVSFVILLVLLLIFILQNLQDIFIKFLGFHCKIPLGVAMLLAAVIGGFLVALFGTARVVQLGRRVKHNKS